MLMGIHILWDVTLCRWVFGVFQRNTLPSPSPSTQREVFLYCSILKDSDILLIQNASNSLPSVTM